MTLEIASVSGGKDSTAMALLLLERGFDGEFVFEDTGCELPETYEYLEKFEAFVGRPLVRLHPKYPFDRLLEEHHGFLPALNCRWCTRYLKILPLKTYVSGREVILYTGIRADENRSGDMRMPQNVTQGFPLRQWGIRLDGVLALCNASPLGLNSVYRWRSSCSCFFCPFQRVSDWYALRKHHPDLWEKAKAFENPEEGHTWLPEPLTAFEDAKRLAYLTKKYDPEAIGQPCLICDL